MLNANYDADAIRDYVKSHPSCRYLLGFNEPNFTKQANMTPQKAAEEWTAVKALADELGLEIVAPAMNYSPNAPYQDPTNGSTSLWRSWATMPSTMWPYTTTEALA